MSLFVPHYFDPTEYAYWQLFILYNSYTGILLFGINDGIYVRIGGKKYEELDYQNLSVQFYVVLAVQVIFAVLISLFSVVFLADSRKVFIFIAIALFNVISNMGTYTNYILQASNRTREFSKSIMINKIAFIVTLMALIVIRTDKFELLVIGYIACQILANIYSFTKTKAILFSTPLPIRQAIKECMTNVKIGLQLMIGYYAGTLVTGIARIFTEQRWGLKTFGQVSFALSLLSFLLLFLGQISIVLFPELKMLDYESQTSYFARLLKLFDLLLPLAYLAYIPMSFILVIWLPKYQTSLYYLAILFPTCIFECKMNIICNTYLKMLRKEAFVLRINIFSMILSTLFTLVGTYLFSNLSVVVYGITITLYIRNTLSEMYLIKSLNLKFSFMQFSDVIFAVLFVFLMSINSMSAAVGMIIAYAVFYFINRNDILLLFREIQKRAVKRVSIGKE
jgi:O-antigen/teichoic acid export membrane protein